jgi:hypothetical protein
MTDKQADDVRKFVKNGGAVIATGESSLYNEWGDRRSDFALADIFGTHILSGNYPDMRKHSAETYHTYLRLSPELRANYDGPKTNISPKPGIVRHPVFKGLDETDIISFGGMLSPLKTDNGTESLMTFIPQFPIYPPETAWMREPVTDIPGLIINNLPGSGRVIYMPADLDRQFGRYNLPDHGNLLANLVRWTSKDNIPLSVEAPGMIDCNIYRQGSNLILHLVNLTSAGTWRQPVDEYIPVGPVKVKIRIPEGVASGRVSLLVTEKEITLSKDSAWASFTIPSITDHELVIIS